MNTKITVNLPDNIEVADIDYDNERTCDAIELVIKAYPEWTSLVVVVTRGDE